MKKKILLLTALFSSTLFKAQQFSENFGSLALQNYTANSIVTSYTTVPNNFSLINDSHNNNVGSTTNPNAPFHVPALKTTGWAVVYNALENDTFLVSTSWLDSTSITCNRWVITPSISNITANTVLTWLAKTPDAAYPDGYEVYGTNKTGALQASDFTIGDRLFSLPDGHTAGGGEKSTWTRHAVYLGNFAGQTLRFAFRNISTNMFQLWIDDIEVKNVSNTLDGQVSSLDIDKYFLLNTQQTVAVNFYNNGAAPINNVTLQYKYGTSQLYSQPFTFPNGLNYGESARCVFPQTINLSSPGCYALKVWATQPNNTTDQNFANDTALVNLTALSTSAPKKVLVEQFVSAMDGNAPAAQDKLLAQQSSSVITVNLHEADSIGNDADNILIGIYRKKTSTGMIDRKDSAGYIPVSPQFYADRITKQLSAATPASLSIINKTYNTNTRQLNFTLKMDFVGDGKGSYGADVYLVENNVYGPPADTTLNGFNQVSNFYNVPWSPYYQKGYYSPVANGWVLDASKYRHQRVSQIHFDNFGWMPLLTSFTTGQTYTVGYSITLPLPTDGSSKYIADNMYIVGYLQENTPAYIASPQRVLNAVEDKITANPEVVGIRENNSLAKLSLYPNPSDGILFIENLAENKNYEIAVFDLLGKRMFSESIKNSFNNCRIDLTGLSTGAYLVEIRSEGRVYREKVVKQ